MGDVFTGVDAEAGCRPPPRDEKHIPAPPLRDPITGTRGRDDLKPPVGLVLLLLLVREAGEEELLCFLDGLLVDGDRLGDRLPCGEVLHVEVPETEIEAIRLTLQ